MDGRRMKSLSRSWLRDVLAFLQLLILLQFSIASPLTLDGANRLSRDHVEASQSFKSTEHGYVNIHALKSILIVYQIAN